MAAIALAFVVLSVGALAPRQSGWRIGPVETPPGEARSGYLDVPAGPDGETRIPITLIHGAAAGPTLALVAGNHGYEYTPMVAAQRLRTIDPKTLRGRVVLVHVANLPSFLKRTIYYSPVDGKNLNRVYPGRRDGTLSERIADVITREVIARADYLVDLHCGDGNEQLRPYTYWMPIGDARVDELSRQMAVAFGMDRIVIDRGRPRDPLASQFCSNTAMTRGKPAITIESGGMGRAYEEADVRRIVRGVGSLLRHLEMTSGKPDPATHVRWLDPAEVVRFPETLAEKSGFFFPQVAPGLAVRRGALLGYITDVFGNRIHEVRAPFDGEVLYVLGTPPVSAGEPLAFVGATK